MLTKTDLFSIKKVINEIVIDASHTILAGVEKMFKERDERLDRMGGRLNKVDGRLDKLELNVRFIRHDINDIKAELSDTPSKREFNELKEKVEAVSP